MYYATAAHRDEVLRIHFELYIANSYYTFDNEVQVLHSRIKAPLLEDGNKRFNNENTNKIHVLSIFTTTKRIQNVHYLIAH